MTLRAAGDGVEFEVTLDPQLLIWNHEVRIRVTRGPDDLGIPSMVIAENDVVAPCDKCVGTAKGDPCVWCGGTGRGMLASAQRIVDLLYAGYRARVRPHSERELVGPVSTPLASIDRFLAREGSDD